MIRDAVDSTKTGSGRKMTHSDRIHHQSDEAMGENKTNTILVPRPRKVRTDGTGRSVWMDPVESAELELVSTQMLKQILSSRDSSDRIAIKHASDTATDGVLARDPNNGQYEIIGDDDLQAILDANQGLPKLTRPADATYKPLRDYADETELSLVSTQALRKILIDDFEEPKESAKSKKSSVGFNPYDSN